MTTDLSDDDKRAVLQELADAGYLMCPKWVADATRSNPGVVTRLGESEVSWVLTAEQDRLVDAHEAALSALADAEMGEAGRRREWAAALRWASDQGGEGWCNRAASTGLEQTADRIEAGELTPWAETDPETAPTSPESAEPAPAPTHGPRDAPEGSQGADGPGWDRDNLIDLAEALEDAGPIHQRPGADGPQIRALLANFVRLERERDEATYHQAGHREEGIPDAD